MRQQNFSVFPKFFKTFVTMQLLRQKFTRVDFRTNTYLPQQCQTRKSNEKLLYCPRNFEIPFENLLISIFAPFGRIFSTCYLHYLTSAMSLTNNYTKSHTRRTTMNNKESFSVGGWGVTCPRKYPRKFCEGSSWCLQSPHQHRAASENSAGQDQGEYPHWLLSLVMLSNKKDQKFLNSSKKVIKIY